METDDRPDIVAVDPDGPGEWFFLLVTRFGRLIGWVYAWFHLWFIVSSLTQMLFGDASFAREYVPGFFHGVMLGVFFALPTLLNERRTKTKAMYSVLGTAGHFLAVAMLMFTVAVFIHETPLWADLLSPLGLFVALLIYKDADELWERGILSKPASSDEEDEDDEEDEITE